LQPELKDPTMAEYLFPGVYVEEADFVSRPIDGVDTSLAGFVGFSEKAQRLDGAPLVQQPTLLQSVAEYESQFGGRPPPKLHARFVRRARSAGGWALAECQVEPAPWGALADAVRQFFANGGQRCLVCSVGAHADLWPTPDPDARRAALLAGLAAIAQADTVPGLLLVPEAHQLDEAGYSAVCAAMLEMAHARPPCFALLDVLNGDQPLTDREALRRQRALWPAGEALKAGAAFAPSLRSRQALAWPADESQVMVSLAPAPPCPLNELRPTLQAALRPRLQAALQRRLPLLPAAPTVAGVLAANDARRGLWKAASDVPLRGVQSLALPLNDDAQHALLLDAEEGKSINPIRAVDGRGLRLWGYRSLAGNDNEWRYFTVCRLLRMVKATLTRACKGLAFEPNEARTWAAARSGVGNFLDLLWRQGALVGDRYEQAYFVRCGLGQTMSEHDVRNGRLVIDIGLACLRPAEFYSIELEMQLSGPSA
jgi:uncharacterized protein